MHVNRENGSGDAARAMELRSGAWRHKPTWSSASKMRKPAGKLPRRAAAAPSPPAAAELPPLVLLQGWMGGTEGAAAAAQGSAARAASLLASEALLGSPKPLRCARCAAALPLAVVLPVAPATAIVGGGIGRRRSKARLFASASCSSSASKLGFEPLA